MAAYQIHLSEQQRAILAHLLRTNTPADAKPVFDGTVADEALVLRDLFEDLPNAEAEMVNEHGCRPGEAVHGFAL